MNDQWKIESSTANDASRCDAPPAFEFGNDNPDLKELSWSPAPATPVLGCGEVHLWRANLDVPSLNVYRDTLSAGEVIRADAFHSEKDRSRFIAAHGILRMILARYLGAEAGAIRFAAGAFGKPSLADIASSVRFNMSHSGDLVVIAVAQGSEVGVDVEQVREDMPFDDIAENYFEPNEVWDIRTQRDSQKAWKFFQLWTGKEARLKASGIGIGNGLNAQPCQAAGWRLHHFSIVNTPTFGVAKEYAGAIAIYGKDWHMECWEWHK